MSDQNLARPCWRCHATGHVAGVDGLADRCPVCLGHKNTTDLRNALIMFFDEMIAGTWSKDALADALLVKFPAIAAVCQAPPSEVPKAPLREAGWLIETGDHMYWNGRRADQDGFTHDPNGAVRFARREDSEQVIYWLMEKFKTFLVSREHIWLNGEPQR